MRSLNRPMFKMGGPIKEGVMHGIREPYKGGGAALVGNPLYPKTDGREHHFKYLKDIPKYIKPGYWTSGWTNPGTLGGKIAGGIKNIFKPRPMNTVYTPFKSPTTGGRIKNWLETSKAGKYIKGTPEGRLTGWGLTAGKGIIPKIAKAALKSPTATLGGAYMLDAFPGGEPLLNLDVLGNRNVLFQRYDPKTNKRIKGTGISSFWEDEENLKKEIKKNLKELPSVEKVLTDAEKKLIEDTKLKNAKAARDKRVNNLLEIMGYDKSKNDAVSKALIDASQIIGERGTLSKKNITRELINPIIAATGKRLEKPEQIREAVGLMMAKGEIEKDIAKGKGSQTAQTARDLVEEGVFPNMRSALDHLSKKVDIADTIAAFAAKGVPTTASSLDIALRSEIKGVIPHVVMENKKWKKVSDGKSELEYVQEIIKDKKPGYYIIDKRIVFVDNEGKATYKW